MREVERGAFKKGKWDICWFRVVEKTTAVLEDVRFVSDWNMYDTLSEGKINSTLESLSLEKAIIQTSIPEACSFVSSFVSAY